MSMIFRRRLLLAALCAFLFGAEAGAEKIRTSVPGLNLNYLSIFSADAKGFFKDEGLENETIVIGGPAGIAALISGDVDFSGAGGSGLRAAVKGAPLGDSEDRFTTLFVERGGLSAKDVTKITLGTSPGDKILGIKSGAVAAVVLDPAGAVAAEREGLRNFAFLGDIFPLPFQGYVTTDRKIAENSAQLKRWVRAVIRGLMFLRERPDEAADVAMKKLQLRNATKAMLIEAIKRYVRALPPGVPGLPSAEGIKNILEYEIRLPLKMDAPVAAEKFLDLRWAAEVKKEIEQKGK